MHRLKSLLNALMTRIRNARQEPLPTTDQAANELIKRVIEACGLDPENDSLRNAIATTMLSLPQGAVKISVNQLRNVVRQAMCKQSNYNIIEDIRRRDKEKREADASEKVQ